jgi:hypothetical protein
MECEIHRLGFRLVSWRFRAYNAADHDTQG